MRINDIKILCFSMVFLTVSGCLEMEVKEQPGHGVIGSTFSATTEVVFRENNAISDEDHRAMLFAVQKPTGWTVNSVTYISPEHGEGTFSYLGNESDNIVDVGNGEGAGIDTGWEDAVELYFPSDDNMHWQMYISDRDTTSDGNADDPDTFHVTVNYTIDELEGNYMLKYYTTHSNNGEASNADNIAMADRPFTAYDPSTSALVSFTLTDGTWTFQDVKFKGEMSDWNLFQGYDDGTNGDATANDHVWTGQFAVIENGNYNWGAIEDDGSANGIWLLEGGNQTVGVQGAEYGGSTDYTVPAFTADPAGSILFTVMDGTESYVNLKLKGSHDDWVLHQMYDDGTNGDATANDHVWTVVVPDVPTGVHTWGAIEDDGSNFGIWLTDGPEEERTYYLEDDLVTYHGWTNYDIPVPVGEPVLVTLSFVEGTRLSGARGNLREVRFKGEHSNWAVYPGELNVRTWSAEYLVEADGLYNWGAINTVNPDGSLCENCNGSDGNGTWLIQGGNQTFGVQNGQYGGTTTYEMPPHSAVSENVVMFTVQNGRPDLYTDIRWKSQAIDWYNLQMYDDGTNGDVTAGDNLWTVLVEDVPNGAWDWGVFDTDNGNGTSCVACDPDDSDGTGSGTWLILDGQGQPKFKLEDDNLTVRGDVHYEIPLPAGPDVTKTVLFNVDMTEWLDEEGNEGMRVFNIANGDLVKVQGSFNGWGNCSGCTMTRTPGTNIFSLPLVVESQPDFEHQFAFYMQLSPNSIAALQERFGVEAVVDWIGWGTSPIHAGNTPFTLGPEDETNLVQLPIASFYDAFPGSVIPEGHTIEATWSVDMSTDTSGFNPAEDSVFFVTQDKWFGITTGQSNGEAAFVPGAVPVGNGIYEFTWSLTGPLMMYHHYKWGYKDMSEDGTEVQEQGGGLGSAARIRYFRQVTETDESGCAWPAAYSFPLDSTFAFEAPDPEDINWEPYVDSANVCVTLTPMVNDANYTVPNNFTVSNNYPNPFNPSTQIEFSLPINSDVDFKVYSLTGTEIYSYSKKSLPVGKYKITWNGKDAKGRSIPSGVYIYEFRAGDKFQQTKKMTLLK